MQLTVLSWNIRALQGIGRRLNVVLDCIGSAEPDIVLLQEIATRWKVPDRVREGLAERGLNALAYSASSELEEKQYGNVIASRWPVIETDRRWTEQAPWPQLLGHATIVVEGEDVDVVVAHIPNGSGNGWKKIETFETIVRYLHRQPDAPRILAGDFNEPRGIRANGQMVTFGQRDLKSGGVSSDGMKKGACGETHPWSRWDQGVRSVLVGESSHGLRNAFHDANGVLAPATHVVRGRDRFFDHMFVSHHFRVESCHYEHGWREDKTSDHSALVCKLELKT